MHHTGSWQAVPPDQGQQGWAAGPGQYGAGPHHTGSWQAVPPDQGQQGWAAGPGQYGAGIHHTGSWQAAGQGQAPAGWAPGAGPQQSFQGQPADGQPFPGQPFPGHAFPGQTFPGQGQPNGAADWHRHQPYSPPPPGMRDTGAFSRVGSPVIRQRDNALPDPPPDAKAPVAALENDNVAAFARDLRVLRAKAGLDYPDMAEKSHYTMRTLASAAGGLRLPTLPVLIAYVNACGGDVSEWEERWGRLMKSGRKGNAALPAAGQDATADDPLAAPDGAGSGLPGTGQIPQPSQQPGEIYVITSAPSRDDRW